MDDGTSFQQVFAHFFALRQPSSTSHSHVQRAPLVSTLDFVLLFVSEFGVRQHAARYKQSPKKEKNDVPSGGTTSNAEPSDRLINYQID